MLVRFLKRPPAATHDLMVCVRPPHAELTLPLPRGGVLPLAAVVFVVESTFRWDDGHFGAVAAGKDVALDDSTAAAGSPPTAIPPARKPGILAQSTGISPTDTPHAGLSPTSIPANDVPPAGTRPASTGPAVARSAGTPLTVMRPAGTPLTNIPRNGVPPLDTPPAGMPRARQSRALASCLRADQWGGATPLADFQRRLAAESRELAVAPAPLDASTLTALREALRAFGAAWRPLAPGRYLERTFPP